MMKNIILFLAFELLLLSTSSCSNSNNIEKVNYFSILEDLTEDNFKATPNSQDVIDYISIDKNKWQGYEIRYSSLTELDLNNLKYVSIDSEKKITGNDYLRKHKIEVFKDSIRSILNKETDTIADTESNIFFPILNELNTLSQLKGEQKELIVFSDLKDNDTEWFSFYNRDDFKLLKDNPEKVIQMYLNYVPENYSFSNVKLHIIYHPFDAKDNHEFRLMRVIYKEVFEKLGVSITFSANLLT